MGLESTTNALDGNELNRMIQEQIPIMALMAVTVDIADKVRKLFHKERTLHSTGQMFYKRRKGYL